MVKNKNIFQNQIINALIAYLIFIILSSLILFPLFKKIKQANLQYQEKMNTYQNLNLKNPSQNKNQPITCEGNLFFKANSPLISLGLFNDYIFTSSLNQKIMAINLYNPTNILSTDGLVTAFYSDSQQLLAADFLNNKIIKINLNQNSLTKEVFSEKIGRPSTLVKDKEGNWLVSCYASGNIVKITGNQKTIFASDLDKIIGLGISFDIFYVIRYHTSPSLVFLDKNLRPQTIEKNKNFSDLVREGSNLWIIYEENNQSKIGKIENNQIKEISSLNCPFPLKAIITEKAIFYTSLADSEGKIYFTKNNLQISGK